MASSRGVTVSCAIAGNDPATHEEAPLPMNFRWFLAASLLLLLCSGTPARASGVAMHVGAPIHPVEVSGGERLVYELHVGNTFGTPVEITALDVLDDDNRLLLHLDECALGSRITLEDGSTVIAPHAQAVLYLTVDAGAKTPIFLRHRLTLKQAGVVSTLTGTEIPVSADRNPVLAPPVAQGTWVAVYSDAWPRGHRRVFIEIHGHARLPGRFAIDWMKVDNRGRTLKDDSGLAASSLSYGAKVRAVADARVAAVRDGVSEAARIADNKTHPHSDAAGNFISLDLGHGRFATYEHLRPGSITVAKDDHVRVGQVIAEVGFSGDSTEPHLHFHVSDSAMPLEGEGLPYALDRFRVVGRVTDWNAFGSQRWKDGSPRIVEHAFPESGDVIDFD